MIYSVAECKQTADVISWQQYLLYPSKKKRTLSRKKELQRPQTHKNTYYTHQLYFSNGPITHKTLLWDNKQRIDMNELKIPKNDWKIDKLIVIITFICYFALATLPPIIIHWFYQLMNEIFFKKNIDADLYKRTFFCSHQFAQYVFFCKKNDSHNMYLFFSPVFVGVICTNDWKLIELWKSIW